MLTALAVLDLLVLGARAIGFVRAGSAARLAAEGPVLYSIWKVRHGYPLYEMPFAPFFPVSLYNFLSYETYAAAFRLLRVPDPLTPAAGRLVTASFALAGAVLQYGAARALLAAPRSSRRLPLLLAVLAWCGPVLPGGWAMAIRPDAGAVALDLAGVWLVLQFLHGRPRSRLVWAGAAFLAAWAFKQSHAVACVATVAYLFLWRRSWRDGLCVLTPWATGVGVALVIGGPVYRANIITAPALSPLLPLSAWFGVRTVVFPEALFWFAAAAAAGVLVAGARDMTGASHRHFGVDLVYPALLTAGSIVASILMLAKAGSAINHALEPAAFAALLTAGVLGGTRLTRGRTCAALGAAAIMLASQTTRVMAERSSLADGIRGADPSAAARRVTADLVAGLPRPIYTDDELYALPWIANGNHYPAVIPDDQVYHSAKDAGLLTDTVEAMVDRRVFASLAIGDRSPLLDAARRAGYHVVDTIAQPGDRPIVILRRTPPPGTR